ncbi:hypothetical protein G9A89_011360 [Geosiphon pyriformis]|nr:hypothetical protein G9A89_011360 [Geosiphon pyriformis]
MMHVARSNIDKESWDARDVYKALLYTLPIGTNAHNIWNYIVSVGGKTCVIDYYLVSYAWTKCATVCFDSAELLDAVIRTTSVLRSVNLHWSHLGFSKCAKYRKMSHTSLDCAVNGNFSSGKPSSRSFLNMDKSRLAIIYVKHLALIAHLIAFDEMKPILSDISDIEKRFVVLENSLASLMGQIGKLAKRLESFVLAVSQPSSGCQLLVTPPSQNWVGDVVMGESSGKATSGETAAILDSSASSEIKKLENILERLSALKIAMCNVKGMNNLAKQNDIICWHKEMNNLISVVIETKLRDKICPWIMNKFNGVQVFTSGLDSGYLGSGVAIIMDNSLVRHVCKISKVSSQLLSLKLLFKNNLSVSILGLYAGALLVVQFSQTGEINSFIAKAVNEFSFVILGGDFNEASA